LRTFLTPDGNREVIESDDGRARFWLYAPPPADSMPQAKEAHRKRRAELVAAIEARRPAPRWRRTLKTSHPRPRLLKSPDATPREREPFAVGDWVTWTQRSEDAEEAGADATGAGAVGVVGQVWSMAPGTGAWWVTTDRSATTGEVHLMNRRKVGADTFAYFVGGAMVSSLGPAGAQTEMTERPYGAVPEPPVSYAAWQPPKGSGLAPVREPVEVYQSEWLLPVWGRGHVRHTPHIEVRADWLTFVITAAGLHHGEPTYRAHLLARGNAVLVTLPAASAVPIAVEACAQYARRVRESARRETDKGDAYYVRYGEGLGVAYSGRYLIPQWEGNGTCPGCDKEGEPLLSVVELPGRREFAAACSWCVGMKHRANPEELLDAARLRYAAGVQGGRTSIVAAAYQSVREWARSEHGADEETARRFTWWYCAHPHDDYPVAWQQWTAARAEGGRPGPVPRSLCAECGR
jgi:hypothetical protein